MNNNHIQLPKASDVIKNTVLMSSYISGFVLKSMLNHTITEILFNVRSVLNQAIDMRKSCEALIMDAHVDHDTIDMYPKYILDAHDEYAVMARLVKNQYLDKNIKNVAEQFAWLEETWYDEQPSTWHYQAHVLASNDEFVQEGRRMHNCVATYAKKMSRGDTIMTNSHPHGTIRHMCSHPMMNSYRKVGGCTTVWRPTPRRCRVAIQSSYPFAKNKLMTLMTPIGSHTSHVNWIL